MCAPTSCFSMREGVCSVGEYLLYMYICLHTSMTWGCSQRSLYLRHVRSIRASRRAKQARGREEGREGGREGGRER